MTTPADDSQRGFTYMVLCAFFFSLMSLLVKQAGQRIPALEIVLARSLVSVVLSWWLLRRVAVSPWGNRRGLLLVRGVLGLGGLTCYYLALQALSLADATVIHHTNPLFVAVLGIWILGERAGWRLAASLTISVVGVILVKNPVWLGGVSAVVSGEGWWGVPIGLLGAALAAAAYVSIRKLRETEHPLVVVFYFPLVSIPIVAPLAFLNWVWPTPQEWLLLLSIGVTTQLAQMFLTRGLHLLPVSRATAIGYLQIPFAMGWGVLFLRETPLVSAVLGAFLVIAGATLLRKKGVVSPTGNSPT